MKITWFHKTFEIKNPDKELWSEAEIASTGTWPKLLIKCKKGSALFTCMQRRVRGVVGDLNSRNYLVIQVVVLKKVLPPNLKP